MLATFLVINRAVFMLSPQVNNTTIYGKCQQKFKGGGKMENKKIQSNEPVMGGAFFSPYVGIVLEPPEGIQNDQLEEGVFENEKL